LEPSVPDLRNWPIPEEYLIELGRIAAVSSALEGHLELCLGRLSGFDTLGDARAFILVKHSSFPQKLDALAALCALLEGQFPNLRGHESVVAQLRSAQALRNKYLHNGIAMNPETSRVEMGSASARGKLKASVEPVSSEDLRQAALQLRAAMASLHQLVTGKSLPPVGSRGAA
jgi:hypothetical protein